MVWTMTHQSTAYITVMMQRRIYFKSRQT